MAGKEPTVRRSQLVTTYGVGAIVPVDSESFIIAGIDRWPAPRDKRHRQVIEPRLARLLKVKNFLSPPSGDRVGVPTFRFPEMVFCPECHRLDKHYKLADQDTNLCADCARPLVPSRFVACCELGHLQDFPYFEWVHSGQDYPKGQHDLTLTVRGASSSLADIVIACSCKVQSVTMQNALGRGSLKQVISSCAGGRPWLDEDDPEPCEGQLVALQRGSSNVWFSVLRSSLSIPPWSEDAFAFATLNWDVLQLLLDDPTMLRGMIGKLRNDDSPSVDEVMGAVEALSSDQMLAMTEELLRSQEYDALRSDRPEQTPLQDFVCTPRAAESAVSEYVASVSEVARLREVRVLQSFTRVDPATSDDATHHGAMSVGRSDWLPAMEVLGEGVFVQLDDERLRAWENSTFAMSRAAAIQRSLDRRVADQGKPPQEITARKLLLHSLGHVLINELSLDTGYPASSIRERVYAADGQAGVLLYTATADAAGSLGGLSAKAAPGEVSRLLRDSVERARWCSADPVCIEATATGSDALNLAACHSCLLVPEVSCEEQNALLDRAALVGTPEQPGDGFFSLLAV